MAITIPNPQTVHRQGLKQISGGRFRRRGSIAQGMVPVACLPRAPGPVTTSWRWSVRASQDILVAVIAASGGSHFAIVSRAGRPLPAFSRRSPHGDSDTDLPGDYERAARAG